ncbi:MAG: hypothetical protein JW774_02615 [Candidatus Aureabacteria bacterium]|nr:hypothetical protein [Candidatus Auribacterota bacterium]
MFFYSANTLSPKSLFKSGIIIKEHSPIDIVLYPQKLDLRFHNGTEKIEYIMQSAAMGIDFNGYDPDTLPAEIKDNLDGNPLLSRESTRAVYGDRVELNFRHERRIGSLL